MLNPLLVISIFGVFGYAIGAPLPSEPAKKPADAVVPATSALSPESAVSAVVHSKEFEHLALLEPQVRVEQSTARVDLRMSRRAGRSVRDLAQAEQLALLGSIRSTLKANARWGIKQVVFTEHGNLLAV
jgi:hypothetical protein